MRMRVRVGGALDRLPDMGVIHMLQYKSKPPLISNTFIPYHSHPQIRWPLEAITVSHVHDSRPLTQRFPCHATLQSVLGSDRVHYAQTTVTVADASTQADELVAARLRGYRVTFATARKCGAGTGAQVGGWVGWGVFGCMRDERSMDWHVVMMGRGRGRGRRWGVGLGLNGGWGI